MFVNSMIVRDGRLSACVEGAKTCLLAFKPDPCLISILPLGHPTMSARIIRWKFILRWCVSRWHLFRKVQLWEWSAKLDGSSIVRLGSLLGGIVRTNMFQFAIILDLCTISFPSRRHADITRSISRSPVSFAFWHLFTSSKSSANTQTNPCSSFHNCEVVRSQI